MRLELKGGGGGGGERDVFGNISVYLQCTL